MSKHNVQYAVEADALRMGFVKRRAGPDFHQITWQIKCSKCPRDFTAFWAGGMKPEAMARHMRVRHWDVDYGMRPLCPDCAHSKDKAPAKKPEHQNFKPFVPAPTLVFDRLLQAAEERSFRENFPKNLATAIAAEADATVAKNHLIETRATAREEERRAKHRAGAKLMWEKRRVHIAERKAAKEAGDKALHLAQLKERARTQPPGLATVRHTPIAPQAPSPQETIAMSTAPHGPTPTPKISHAVFQCLDAIFDGEKRLYRSGYTDQRVAKECGCSEDVVAYLRTETFGALAEDPRISSMRDDLELLRMESAEMFAKLQRQLGDISSRLEQVAHK